MCPKFWGYQVRYSYIQAIVLVIVDYLPKKPRAHFLGVRCDICLLFQILLMPIDTWWVLNFAIKYSDLSVKFAAFVGMLTGLRKRGGKSGCGNIFRSCTLLQSKQAWWIWSWLKLDSWFFQRLKSVFSILQLRWFPCFACASLTVHNKMAAVKQSMWSNIIKMKLTEEKHYWNFCLWLFLAEVRLNVLGMCIT